MDLAILFRGIGNVEATAKYLNESIKYGGRTLRLEINRLKKQKHAIPNHFTMTLS